MPLPKDKTKIEEYKRKLSEVAKKRGFGKWMLGKKHTEETKKKMSKIQKKIGNTPEERKKRSKRAKKLGYGKWMKGRKNTPFLLGAKKEIRKRKGKTYVEIYGKERAVTEAKKRSEGNKKFDLSNQRHTLKGQQRCDEARKKIALNRKGKPYQEIYGDRAKNEVLKRKLSLRKRWIGKRKADLRPKHNSDYRYTEWRNKVFERDNYTCQVCFIKGGCLEAHHIKPWAKYHELRYIVSNGLTVHKGKCHKKATKYEQ